MAFKKLSLLAVFLFSGSSMHCADSALLSFLNVSCLPSPTPYRPDNAPAPLYQSDMAINNVSHRFSSNVIHGGVSPYDKSELREIAIGRPGHYQVYESGRHKFIPHSRSSDASAALSSAGRHVTFSQPEAISLSGTRVETRAPERGSFLPRLRALASTISTPHTTSSSSAASSSVSRSSGFSLPPLTPRNILLVAAATGTVGFLAGTYKSKIAQKYHESKDVLSSFIKKRTQWLRKSTVRENSALQENAVRHIPTDVREVIF